MGYLRDTSEGHQRPPTRMEPAPAARAHAHGDSESNHGSHPRAQVEEVPGNRLPARLEVGDGGFPRSYPNLSDMLATTRSSSGDPFPLEASVLWASPGSNSTTDREEQGRPFDCRPVS